MIPSLQSLGLFILSGYQGQAWEQRTFIHFFFRVYGSICFSLAIQGPEVPLRMAYFPSCSSGISLYPLQRGEYEGIPPYQLSGP